MPNVTGNYHTHSRYDDGHGELEEYAAEALRLGFRSLGFSGHAPMGLETSWLMSTEGLQRYLEDFRELRARLDGRLEVLLGLETDWLAGYSAPTREVGPGLDYVIGSVHYVVPGWTVDGPPEEMDRGVERDFGGDIRSLVRAYYACVTDMVRNAKPDIVGHIDLVKKNNRGSRLFREEEVWYREAALDALEVVAAAGCVVEVNTGGLIRGTTDTPYPSPWLLAECARRGIPVVLSSDAHRPEHLVGRFEEARAEMGRSGYTRRVELTGRGWVEREL